MKTDFGLWKMDSIIKKAMISQFNAAFKIIPFIT